MCGGKPVASRVLDLAPGPNPTVLYGFKSSTDENGNFTFTNVPPRQFYLFLKELPRPLESMIGSHSAHGPALAIRAGETTTVSLDLYPVTARLIWPAGADRQADWRVQGSLELIPLSGELPSEFPLREAEDGTWQAEDVPAGNYTVRFNVFVPNSESAEGELAWQAEAPLIVPAERFGGVVNAGEIILQPTR